MCIDWNMISQNITNEDELKRLFETKNMKEVKNQSVNDCQTLEVVFQNNMVIMVPTSL